MKINRLILSGTLLLGTLTSLASCGGNIFNSEANANIVINPNIKFGTVNLEKPTYKVGDTARLLVTPDKGYELSFLEINHTVIEDLTSEAALEFKVIEGANYINASFALENRNEEVEVNLRDFEFLLTEDGSSYEITSYLPTGKIPTTCTIPDTYLGKPVTGIITKRGVGDKEETYRGFVSAIGIQKVVIGKNIKTIHPSAFQGTDSIKEFIVNEENSVYASKNGDLYSKDFETLVLASYNYKNKEYKLDSSVKHIGDYAFQLQNIASYDLGTTVESIGKYSFLRQINATSITIPDSVTTIGEGAFNNCLNLKTLNIGNGITETPYKFAYLCPNLEEVTLSKNLKKLNSYSFGDCGKISSITLPEGLEVIEEKGLSGLKGLKKVNLPSTVKKLGNGALSYNTVLETLTLNEGLLEIGDSCFEGTPLLKEVNIPSTVSKIGTAPFNLVLDLENIKVSETNANYKSVDGVLLTKDGKTLVAYPAHKESKTVYSVPEGVENIAFRAFAYAGTSEATFPVQFAGVKLPESVKKIAPLAFEGTHFTEISYLGSKEYFEANIKHSHEFIDGMTCFWNSGSKIKTVSLSDGTTIDVSANIEGEESY